MEGFRRILSNKGSALGLFLLVFLLFLVVFGPLIAPHSPYKQSLRNSLQPPSSKYWLGTDEVGRDIFSRIIYGSRISLGISAGGVTFGGLAGLILGVIAGIYEGKLGGLIMRLMDVLYSFPSIILAIILMSLVGQGAVMVALTVGIYTIPIIGRTARGQVLTVKNKEYVEAAVASGSATYGIVRRHILGNIMLPILVLATLRLGTALLIASSLGFLGLGVQPPAPEWGAMLSRGRDFLWLAPHVTTFPGLAIAISVLSFNLIGDGVRDVVDPKTRYQTQ
ncbi:MAG: ABC transporter permease [Candidatus Bipolaricaulota bacterium]